MARRRGASPLIGGAPPFSLLAIIMFCDTTSIGTMIACAAHDALAPAQKSESATADVGDMPNLSVARFLTLYLVNSRVLR